MKPQQLFTDVSALGQMLESHLRCARESFPTLTAVAVAIASTVVLTLGGCASSAGIASKAQPIEPARVGIVASAASAPAVVADGWRGFGDDHSAPSSTARWPTPRA